MNRNEILIYDRPVVFSSEDLFSAVSWVHTGNKERDVNCCKEHVVKR